MAQDDLTDFALDPAEFAAEFADINARIVPDILRMAALEGNLATTMVGFRDEGMTENELAAALAAAGLTQDDMKMDD
jgi:hypothetical protein